MTQPNRNMLWAEAVADELQRCGVRDVCVSPGSRSTPLALAAHQRKGLRVTTHLDERSGAFFALGAAKATGVPAAVVCTSGTAAANYLPAVVEASESSTPLIVITADRPPELRGVGANQSIDQHHLYGGYVRFFADPGLPQVTGERIRHLRGLVCRAVAAAASPHPGPVHLNFPFQEPLEPTPVAGDVPPDWEDREPLAARGRSGNRPFVEIPASFPRPDDAAFDAAARLLSGADRVLVVAGPCTEAAEVLDLSAALGAPVLCDPLSNLRFGPARGAQRIAAYDAWLGDDAARRRVAPAVVLRFGAPPTSKALLQALAAWDAADVILVDPGPRRAEPGHRASLVLGATSEAAAQALLARVKGRRSEAYGRKLADIERAAATVISSRTPRIPFEGSIVAGLVAAQRPGSVLWVGSSLPVRDLDRFGAAREAPLRVLANRGASGIDGVVSSALGTAHALGRRITLLLGDVSFLHDLSGAVAAARLGIPLDVVVLNNDGGGIFEFLPISRHEPPFVELFVTPHGLDLAKIAASIGWDAATVVPDGLAKALEAPASGPRLLHLRTDRKENVRQRRALEASLREALAARPSKQRGR